MLFFGACCIPCSLLLCPIRHCSQGDARPAIGHWPFQAGAIRTRMTVRIPLLLLPVLRGVMRASDLPLRHIIILLFLLDTRIITQQLPT
jgi:hypothetical protein